MEIPMRAVLGRRTFLFEGMALATLTACRGEPQDLREGEGEAVRDASADTLMTGSGDAAAVLERSLEIAEAANALNLERLMSYMHADITYLVPSRVPIVGWDDVRTYYAGIHERFRAQGQHFHLTSVPHRVVAIGDWAWKWGETHAVRDTARPSARCRPAGDARFQEPEHLQEGRRAMAAVRADAERQYAGHEHLGVWWALLREPHNGRLLPTGFELVGKERACFTPSTGWRSATRSPLSTRKNALPWPPGATVQSDRAGRSAGRLYTGCSQFGVGIHRQGPRNRL